jgi:hypothetical protein
LSISPSLNPTFCSHRRLWKRGAKQEKTKEAKKKNLKLPFFGKKGKKTAGAKTEEKVVEETPVEVKEVIQDIKEEMAPSASVPPAEEMDTAEKEESAKEEEEEPAEEEDEPIKEEAAETEEREAAPEDEPVSPAPSTPALADDADEEDAEVAVTEVKAEPTTMTSLNDRLINLCGGCTL